MSRPVLASKVTFEQAAESPPASVVPPAPPLAPEPASGLVPELPPVPEPAAPAPETPALPEVPPEPPEPDAPESTTKTFVELSDEHAVKTARRTPAPNPRALVPIAGAA